MELVFGLILELLDFRFVRDKEVVAEQLLSIVNADGVPRCAVQYFQYSEVQRCKATKAV